MIPFCDGSMFTVGKYKQKTVKWQTYLAVCFCKRVIFTVRSGGFSRMSEIGRPNHVVSYAMILFPRDKNFLRFFFAFTAKRCKFAAEYSLYDSYTKRNNYGTDINDRPHGHTAKSTVRPALRGVRHEREHRHQCVRSGRHPHQQHTFFDSFAKGR